MLPRYLDCGCVTNPITGEVVATCQAHTAGIDPEFIAEAKQLEAEVQELEHGICNHPDFHSTVNVIRIEDTLSYSAEIRIRCIACGIPFRFTGLPGGISMTKPTVSIFANEVDLPIEPMHDMPQDKWEALH